MKKKSGPPLTREKLPLERCPYCNGNGTVKPMFHEMVCASCNGLGGVNKETGAGLSADDVIMQLRIRLRERTHTERLLRRQLADLKDESGGRGYGAGWSRYHGD